MKNVSIRTKLFLTVLAVVLPSLILVGALSYLSGRATVESLTFDHLTSVRNSKANQITSYLGQLRIETKAIASGRLVVEALEEFAPAFSALQRHGLTPEQQSELRSYYAEKFLPRLNANALTAITLESVFPVSPAAQVLQYHYIAANPYPAADKELLVSADDESTYNNVHARLHIELKSLEEQFGYNDLLLVDTAGNVVYSVLKEVDLATNLNDGPYRASNLAAAYRAALSADADSDAQLVDFEMYPPSFNEPAAFIAAPVDEGGERIGVLVFQLPIEDIDHVMTGGQSWLADGLGKTGETYLVGPDYLLRSSSRFFLEDKEAFLADQTSAGASDRDLLRIREFGTTILLQLVRTDGASAAMAGETATTIGTDYRGVSVLTSYAPLDIEGLHWAVLSEIDAAEAFAPTRRLSHNLVLTFAVIALLVLPLSWAVARRFVTPILTLESAANRFGQGDQEVNVEVGADDELGRLSTSFNQMVTAIRNQTATLTRSNEELESISTVIVRWNPRGEIISVNPYGEALFDFARGELEGRPIVGTMVPDREETRRSVRRMIDEIAADPKKFELDESENCKKNGEFIWMAWRNKPILNDDGVLREILTIGIDITKRRLVEKEVMKQKEMLENTLESLTHPFYVIDVNDYSILVANSAARKLGISGETTCHALTHKSSTPCDSDDDPCPLEAIRMSGLPVVMEHIHHDADGNPRFVEVHGYPVFNSDGELIQMIEYSLDITERKEAETALQKSEERIHSMVDNIPGVVYRCLLDEHWTMLFISDEIERLSGHPAADFLGEQSRRTFAQIMHPDDIAPVAENAAAAVRDHLPYVNEYRVIDSSGGVHWVYAKGQATYDADGTPLYLDGTIFDITDRKKMEDELARTRDAADSANRAKSAFLANMSHELRTPMNAIIGYSEMLAEDAEDEGHDDMIPDLEKINAAGKHLLALINDILDLSKIEAGRMDLYLERFELHQMLDEAVATVSPLVTKKKNRIETEFDDELGVIRADLTKVRQALFNLLSNAAKFTEDGTITLAAKREKRGDVDWILMSVTDTGIGIPENKLEHVFEEFSQADDSTTRDYGGTGLGLPISRRFCQMMGGDISVTSEAGRGSTFTIELPAQIDALEAARAASRSEDDQVAPIPKGVHPILIIDDDPDSRELLRRTFEADGFAVATAASGEEGLDLARSLHPAFITLDIMMPGMDGWAVLKELKADPELEHTPVAMISIVGDEDLGYSLGAVDHLVKPVDRDQLRRLARQFAQPGGDGHALVVDDDEAIRSLFRRALEGDGWTVDEAEHGVAALDRVSHRRPDLILLDLMMPIMDGFEFMLELRKNEGWASIPVIVVTAKDLTEEEGRRLNGGVERIVQKGALTRHELLVEVRSLVSRVCGDEGDPVGDPEETS